jgi:hypothetical protein
VLVGDEGLLCQVLVNLVGNAVKFTDRGEVAVAVRQEEAASTPGRVGLPFSVRDNGIGISADALGSVFERFTQVGRASHARHEGTRLELAIPRKLVGLLGREIRVESEPRSRRMSSVRAVVGASSGLDPRLPAPQADPQPGTVEIAASGFDSPASGPVGRPEPRLDATCTATTLPRMRKEPAASRQVTGSPKYTTPTSAANATSLDMISPPSQLEQWTNPWFIRSCPAEEVTTNARASAHCVGVAGRRGAAAKAGRVRAVPTTQKYR